MKLQYKTRGNSSPQGKPRVYFSCHPADFRLYFQPISEEILEKQNCAIWYDTEPEAEYDSEPFKLSLSQMQLFVIPVTTRFLCQENRALSVELPYREACRIWKRLTQICPDAPQYAYKLRIARKS